MDGILNMYKPPGITSNDLVMALKRELKPSKIGHTGTLDPEASGVLPICLDKATRIAQYVVEGKKTYIAQMKLGLITDTQDMSGKILDKRAINVSVEEIFNTIYSFKGKQQQVPPMHSAIKHNGTPLYKLARRGESVERTSRTIEIYNIFILDIELPDLVTFKVECSKGTYIRTLCHDIGQRLGCGASMSYLLRTQVGDFHIINAVDIEFVKMLNQANLLSQIVIPMDKALENFTAIFVNYNGYQRVLNGSSLYKIHIEHVFEELRAEDMVRIYYKDQFLAIGKFWQRDNVKYIRPIKVFAQKE